MPHRAEQSFAVGVSVRNNISGLCAVRRVMILALDGLCLLAFFVTCMKRVSYSIESVVVGLLRRKGWIWDDLFVLVFEVVACVVSGIVVPV